MNAAHLHLVVNHLPLIFPIVGIIIMITGIILKSEVVKRTAFMIFIFGAFSAIIAMTTGEGAEEIVENINGVTENYIEAHEESAEIFSSLSYILGGISLIGLWASFTQNKISKVISNGTLIFAMVLLLFAKQTGTTGGEIIHTEIRKVNSVPTNEGFNDEKHEDD